MRLIKLIPVALILFSVASESCKKGADDPAISFRTRKNRVVGEWKVVQGTYKQLVSGPGVSATGDFYSLTENEYTITHDVEGQLPDIYKGTYSRTFKFEKNGDVRIYERFDNQAIIINGTWDFNSGIGSDKSKELITIHYKNVSQPVGYYTYSGNQKDMTFSITELRNKKIVLLYEQTQTQTNGNKTEIVEKVELKQ